ncbi:hypothetical protein SAMN05428642_101667 [Flaviramulus basaltis]|uniref:ThuA-like domain-containing protein n=1 Tax=Flaviramulus basaltis TaxID=369401 RepID=A0A1K2ICH5_9FLAO|nr:ThuA domain-containing protein [Flaviramulus basaltis]SFZ89970.1 hypothetical protein SAMN05428642_101667 [Flaviramulus basaltis]
MKAILIVLFVFITNFSEASDKVLVFSKTEGYRHQSIETGIETIKKLGEENDFEVTHTENSEVFTDENLKQYHLVIFLNTTGNVLNDDQEKAFKTFIENGGSFMGIHSATDTEYDWPWYNKLVGAYFDGHPEQSKATVKTINNNHQSTKHLSEEWIRHDEWYNFKSISNAINVLLTLDESTYKGGKNGEIHPIAWYQEFDGGRMFYTGLGHTNESYSEPEFKKHLVGGILYCLKR